MQRKTNWIILEKLEFSCIGTLFSDECDVTIFTCGYFQALQRNKEQQLQIRQATIQNMRLHQTTGHAPQSQIAPPIQQQTPSQPAQSHNNVCNAFSFCWYWYIYKQHSSMLADSSNNACFPFIDMSCVWWECQMVCLKLTWRDCSALQHLPALNNKRNYCIHVHVYLFDRAHVHLSIGLTVMHI